MKSKIREIVKKYGVDPTRLMDILLDIQKEYRCIPGEAITELSVLLKLSVADIRQTLSFYHFSAMNRWVNIRST